MEKDMIGTILKNRIKEMGYTQEEFAEITGISHSALKKYVSGKNAYDYVMLDRFATELKCSYDFLLGKSKSPIREYHEITEQTRLSEKAIEKIVAYSRLYDKEDRARLYILIVNLLLEEDGLWESIANYLTGNKIFGGMQNSIMGFLTNMLDSAARNVADSGGLDESDLIMMNNNAISLETFLLMDIVLKLKSIKPQAIEIVVEELKKRGTSPIELSRELDILISEQEER